MPGIGAAVETTKLPLNVGAICLLRWPGVETTAKTNFASRYGTAPYFVGNGLAHSSCIVLVETENHIVGAGIARPFFMVFSAFTGRADAKDVQE